MNPEISKNLSFLRLFIKKADELNSYSYFEKKESIVSMQLTQNEHGEFVATFSYPSNEQKKALLLTLRMFIQKKDRIYYRKFLDFYLQIPFSNKWSEDVRNIFFELDMRLDRLVIEGHEHLTRNDLFIIFLYGDEGHLTQREKYLELVTSEAIKEFHESTFHEVIIDYSSAIISLANISRRELQNLGIPIEEVP